MLALAFEEARLRERLVVLELQVRELDPHPRGVERAHVRRKAPVRLVQVNAEGGGPKPSPAPRPQRDLLLRVIAGSSRSPDIDEAKNKTSSQTPHHSILRRLPSIPT